MNYGDQIWLCTLCETPRSFGNGFPEDVREIFKINCSHCQKATPHKFSHVDYDPRSRAARSNARAVKEVM